MHRRRYLRVGAATLAAGVAGCTGGFTAGPTETPSSPPADDGAVAAGASDLDLPVPRDQMIRGAPKDPIPAIVDPGFGADWSGLTVEGGGFRGVTSEPRLRGDDRVIGVARDGEARAYPLRVLTWHEVVNDTFGGPLLVTYCPLCGSAVTAGGPTAMRRRSASRGCCGGTTS